MRVSLSVTALLVAGAIATPVPDPQTSSVPAVSILPAPIVQKCPINQVYKQCGTPCPATCLKSGPQICPTYCKPGCQCKDGFVTNAIGLCVPKALCFLDILSSIFNKKDVEQVDESKDSA